MSNLHKARIKIYVKHVSSSWNFFEVDSNVSKTELD